MLRAARAGNGDGDGGCCGISLLSLGGTERRVDVALV